MILVEEFICDRHVDDTGRMNLFVMDMLMILIEEFICDGHVDDIGRRIYL